MSGSGAGRQQFCAAFVGGDIGQNGKNIALGYNGQFRRCRLGFVLIAPVDDNICTFGGNLLGASQPEIRVRCAEQRGLARQS